MEAACMFLLRCLCAELRAALAAGAPVGEPAISRAKTGITVQEQQAPLPPRLQDKSSSFQLTLSPQQTEEGIMLEFSREKMKSEGISKGNCPGCPGVSPTSEGIPANAAHPHPMPGCNGLKDG